MTKKLTVWDFDGTLFFSPENTPENRDLYEKEKGIPWIIDKKTSEELTKSLGYNVPTRKGWWGKKETLEAPLVPEPTPPEMFNKEICKKFMLSKQEKDNLSVILTGRPFFMKNQVLRILRDGKLLDVAKNSSNQYKCVDAHVNLYCLGDDGPAHFDRKPSDTYDWKIWIIKQILFMMPTIEEIEIYEDREEHVEKFKKLSFDNINKIIVHHVKK